MRTPNRFVCELQRMSDEALYNATREDGSVLWYEVEDLKFDLGAESGLHAGVKTWPDGNSTARVPCIRIESPNGNVVTFGGRSDGWRTNNRRTRGDLAATSLGVPIDVIETIESVVGAMWSALQDAADALNEARREMVSSRRSVDDAVRALDEIVEKQIPARMKSAVRSAMAEYTTPGKGTMSLRGVRRGDVPDVLAPVLPHLRAVEEDESSYVYFLIDGGTVVYVGETCVTVESRIRDHRKDKKFDRVLAMVVPARIRKETEDEWIQRLKPKYNRTVRYGPTGRPALACPDSACTTAPDAHNTAVG